MAQSRLQAVLRAKDNLPAEEKALFSQLFQERVSVDQICRRMSIPAEEFKQRKSRMLRTLMQTACATDVRKAS